MKTPARKQQGRKTHLHVQCIKCHGSYEFSIMATRGEDCREENDARAAAVLESAGATLPGMSGIKCPRCNGRPPSGKLRKINPEDPKTWKT